jgi:sensor c-di-GMP phosphodiesterase-like protein
MLLQRADVPPTPPRSRPPSCSCSTSDSSRARHAGSRLAGELRRALDADELEVFFQPLVSLRDRQLVGVECLARWERPAHGSVSPEDFVAVASTPAS